MAKMVRNPVYRLGIVVIHIPQYPYRRSSVPAELSSVCDVKKMGLHGAPCLSVFSLCCW